MSGQNQSRVCSRYPLPYGASTFLSLGFMVVAYILFAIAAFSCDSFEYKDPDDDSKTEYGYWGHMGPDLDDWTKEKCYSFNDHPLGSKSEFVDTPLKIGRAVGVTGAVLGGLTIILMVLTSFLVLHRSVFIAVGDLVGIFMALFSLALSLGILTEGCTSEYLFGDGEDDDDDEFKVYCNLTGKGWLMAGAFVLWIVGTSVMCCCMGGPRSDDEAISPAPNVNLHVTTNQNVSELKSASTGNENSIETDPSEVPL